jgi:hypothetical protein
VVLEYQVAPAGRSYKATFKVGHGCGASPTRQITVDIPAGVRGAKPMPKPGWALDVQRAKLATPYTSHGRTVTEDVVRITWTAKTKDDYLPNAHYDEFALVGQLPDKDGADVLARGPAVRRRPQRLDRSPQTRPEAVGPQKPGGAAGHPARRRCVRPQSLTPWKETP